MSDYFWNLHKPREGTVLHQEYTWPMSSHGRRTANAEISHRSTNSRRLDPSYSSNWSSAATIYYPCVSYWITAPHYPWNWTYSTWFILYFQYPQISRVPGVITGGNMVISNFGVQQVNFPQFHTPRFSDVHTLREMNHGPHARPRTIYPYYFPMAQHGGGQHGIPQTFTVNQEQALQETNQNQVGDVSTRLSREVILEHLKRIVYQRSVSDDDKCCICLDDYCDGQIIGVADCSHRFHYNCITRWLMEKNSCPLCRRIALRL